MMRKRRFIAGAIFACLLVPAIVLAVTFNNNTLFNANVTIQGQTRCNDDLFIEGGNRLFLRTASVLQVLMGSDGLHFSRNGNVFIDHSTPGKFIRFRTSASTALDTNALLIKGNGDVIVESGDMFVSAGKMDVNGDTITKVLEITGGADLSEQFDITPISGIAPEAGMLVCIDPSNPGKLVVSKGAYDSKVVGVISGAGGLTPGMRMSMTGVEIASGEFPIALVGRVYCLVDATDHAIEPGDMLTTAARAGHAMKSLDRNKAIGATIGKAMTPLAMGEKGLVLVLINLQ